MFITGPQVIRQVTGEQITADALGGPGAHMAHSGVIHFIADDDTQGAGTGAPLSLSSPPTTSRTRHGSRTTGTWSPNRRWRQSSRSRASKATTSAG